MKRLVFILSLASLVLLLVGCGCQKQDHTHEYGEDYVCKICKEMAKQSAGLDYSFDGASNSYTVIGKGICTDKEIVSPFEHNGSPVKKIQKYAFYDSDITSLVISSNITEIEDFAISNCQALTEIIVSTENENFKSVDGSLYTKDGKRLVQYALGKKDSEFTVPSGVSELGACAFSNAPYLKTVNLGDVKAIGASAFNSCLQLEEINLYGVETVKEYAFYGCSNLRSVKISESTQKIGVWAFYSSQSLKISCDLAEKPDGWHDEWKGEGITVTWGNK